MSSLYIFFSLNCLFLSQVAISISTVVGLDLKNKRKPTIPDYLIYFFCRKTITVYQ
jgi:hypothetical protein